MQLPPQSVSAENTTVYRAAPRPVRSARAAALRGGGVGRATGRLPAPRLTGLGAGLFALAAMLLVAGVCWLLFGGSQTLYCVLFLPVAAATALWVRPADLVTAPVAVPIAFAGGVWPITGGSGGFGSQLMGLVTALALHAGWLYGGTLVAALIVIARKAVLLGQRGSAPVPRRSGPPRPGREGGGRRTGRVSQP
ncbi:DUF6542 domain-containing protein [Streptomyces sp. NPDC006879]|uniref:DUF6542 domain-containing protein n=1 Tax=Streptomyces sp. NPDC006879 TaxID=3364767 RepID=UPI0036C911F8